METKFVKITFDLDWDWEGIQPEYRIFVNDELFAERTYRVVDPYYHKEILQVEGEPGTYQIRLEPLVNIGKYKISNLGVEYGKAKLYEDLKFEIL